MLALGCMLTVGSLAVAQQAEDEAEPQEEPSQDTAAADTRAAPEGSYPEVEGLQVRSVVLAEGYEDRQPVDESTTFDKGRIFAVIQIENRNDEPAEIFVSFPPEGKRGGKGLKLSVPANAEHRTVAMTWATPRDPGNYQTVIRNAEGEELAKKEFRIDR